MKALSRRMGNPLGLALVLATAGCTARTTSSEQVGAVVASALVAADAGTSVSGYGTCKDLACADVARGCDDIIRSGCGAAFLVGANGTMPAVPRCSSTYDEAVAACTVATMGELEEVAEKAEAPAGTPLIRPKDMLALEFAKCTRRATTCAERIDCSRGIFIPGHVSFDAGTPNPPFNEDAGQLPAWSEPWKPSNKSKPLWTGAPWQHNGVPEIELMPGVDSLSCAECAVERCPTFAYRCFSAAGDATECPSGNCCHSLRKCVESCGGYKPNATKAMFYSCMSQCDRGRPKAAQELADLQNCARVACAGCQAYDHPGSGLRTQP